MEKGAELVSDFFEDNGFVERQRFQVRDDLREQELGMWILSLVRAELTIRLRAGVITDGLSWKMVFAVAPVQLKVCRESSPGTCPPE